VQWCCSRHRWIEEEDRDRAYYKNGTLHMEETTQFATLVLGVLQMQSTRSLWQEVLNGNGSCSYSSVGAPTTFVVYGIRLFENNTFKMVAATPNLDCATATAYEGLVSVSNNLSSLDYGRMEGRITLRNRDQVHRHLRSHPAFATSLWMAYFAGLQTVWGTVGRKSRTQKIEDEIVRFSLHHVS